MIHSGDGGGGGYAVGDAVGDDGGDDDGGDDGDGDDGGDVDGDHATGVNTKPTATVALADRHRGLQSTDCPHCKGRLTPLQICVFVLINARLCYKCIHIYT